MNLPAPITPAEARAVWDRMDHPSSRRVARALTQSGRPIHFSTVARWKAEGWRSVEHGPHPLEMARRAIDAALPVLTGDATVNVSDLMKTDPLAGELMNASPEHILSAVMHEACTVHILVSEELCRHPELVSTKPREFAILLNALTALLKAMDNLHVQVLDLVHAQDEARAAAASKA
jgi:hypothetical protein